ncbi:MAG: metallophosphoesterase [Candidatus Magasanikbacteria bacterium]|nr:metallophosphoesterase [Candidatus Magasanikbacteria bacterium]
MSHIITIILLILAALGIVFASHFFVYYSLGHFFKIVNPDINTAMAIVISILAVSFIVASVLAHWKENIFTRALYFTSGLWLGLLVNLIIALLLGWLVSALVHSVGIYPNLAIIGVLSVILALIYTSWGVWSAFNPVVRHVDITIKNLPEYWKQKTVVQISDVHLGHVFNKNFLNKVVSQINAEMPEAVFITGDLFDGMDGQLVSHVGPLDSIIAKYGVFFITGNHEIYFGVDRAKQILSQTKVRILSDETVDLEGLQIVGLNYSDQFEDRDLVKLIGEQKNFSADRPAILLYHSPVQVDKIKKAGIDLQLAGHTHGGQMFPFGYITRLIFRGYDYGLSRDGDFSIYTTSGVGTWGPTIRTGNRPEIVVLHFQ